MLYQLHEFQKALLQPVSSWARAASEAFINASNPASKVPGSERLHLMTLMHAGVSGRIR